MASRKRKALEPSLDDILREGIYQRTHGPHKPGAIASLESWERRAVDVLARFTELDEPDAGSVCFPVCGRWRFFAAPDAKTDDCLFKLAIAFWAFNDAYQSHDELCASPTVEAAERFAYACMQATYFSTDVGVVTGKTWQLGERRLAHAATMREAKEQKLVRERKQKRRRADEALEWARHSFPTAAHDDYIGFLKDKAAEHLGKSRDTLDRHLEYGD